MQKVIVGIPGKWIDRSELEEKILEVSGGEYFFKGIYLKHASSNIQCEIAFYEYNPSLYNAFSLAGRGMIDKEILFEIMNHRSIVYLQFDSDMPDLRYNLLGFTSLLEKAGGLALKVETSGVAHSFTMWKDLLRSNSNYDLYQAVTTCGVTDNFIYSCGMQQFLLPDTTISNDFDQEYALSVIAIFNHYQMTAENELLEGDSFQISEDAHVHILRKKDDFIFPDDPYFHNPFGRWVLE